MMMLDQLCVNDVLLDAAKEVFQTMIFLDIEKSPDAKAVMEGDTLLASITFKGDLQGYLGICCDLSCAKTVAANMLNMNSVDPLGEQEVVDALGEVANMVMGRVKIRLLETLPNIEVSIPTVVAGQELRTSPGERSTKTLIPVRIGGQYNVDLYLVYRSKP
jgi:chemotaxis protein CheX